MHPIIVNKKSWHYRLATVYGPLSDSNFDKSYWNFGSGVDSCRYIRSIFLGFLLTLLLFIGSCLVLGPIVDFLVWFIASMVGNGFVGQPHFFPILLGLIFSVMLIGVGLGIVWLWQKIADLLWKTNAIYHEPSTMNKLYDSFKNKFCVPIEVKND